MARTTAPLFSLDASGSLANAVVFSKWRGRQYVRRHTIPKNPQTPAQVGIRAMMKFLSQEYKALKATIDVQFAEPAAAKNVSAFNAYVAHNMRRWRENRGPSMDYPSTETATAITIVQSLTGGQRNVLISNDPSADDGNFGIVIYRSLAAIVTVNWNLCIAIIHADAGNAVTFTDAPLAAGTYHYRSAICNETGKIGTACADASASVT